MELARGRWSAREGEQRWRSPVRSKRLAAVAGWAGSRGRHHHCTVNWGTLLPGRVKGRSDDHSTVAIAALDWRGKCAARCAARRTERHSEETRLDLPYRLDGRCRLDAGVSGTMLKMRGSRTVMDGARMRGFRGGEATGAWLALTHNVYKKVATVPAECVDPMRVLPGAADDRLRSFFCLPQ